MSPILIDLRKLEPGDLILTSGTGIGSKLLRTSQVFLNATPRSPYSHASLYLGGAHIFEATVERGVSIGFLARPDTKP
jgi:cell wall-associated NlpC family hydrolase